MDSPPRISITYCTKCNFLPRAAWLAQELLHTFGDSLAGVTLVPGSGGVFEVACEGDTIFSTKSHGRFPETRELRELVGARVEGGWKSRHA
ncbi:MAG: SelT/SelW/SelH family protein [Dehalococcoidia bacterium]